MTKANYNINVFCSVSDREINKVKVWIIPSLIRQKNINQVILYLVQYTGINSYIYDGPNEMGNVIIKEINKLKQCGFGEAHNYAFNLVKPKDYFLIVNPDVYLHELCISRLIDKFFEDGKKGMVEARQLPFEHPKEFNKQTEETPWASGSCLLLNSEFFQTVGGFDENFWMYCEDVDLSWRAWLNGFRVIYNREAVAYHFTGVHYSYSSFKFSLEHFWSARNFLYLMYKYWGKDGEKNGKKIFMKTEYPNYFKEEVLKSFNELKQKINLDFYMQYKTLIGELRSKIKIIDFNQYHNFHNE